MNWIEQSLISWRLFSSFPLMSKTHACSRWKITWNETRWRRHDQNKWHRANKFPLTSIRDKLLDTNLLFNLYILAYIFPRPFIYSTYLLFNWWSRFSSSNEFRFLFNLTSAEAKKIKRFYEGTWLIFNINAASSLGRTVSLPMNLLTRIRIRIKCIIQKGSIHSHGNFNHYAMPTHRAKIFKGKTLVKAQILLLSRGSRYFSVFIHQSVTFKAVAREFVVTTWHLLLLLLSSNYCTFDIHSFSTAKILLWH